jgi:hypothetical protein
MSTGSYFCRRMKVGMAKAKTMELKFLLKY